MVIILNMLWLLNLLCHTVETFITDCISVKLWLHLQRRSNSQSLCSMFRPTPSEWMSLSMFDVVQYPQFSCPKVSIIIYTHPCLYTCLHQTSCCCKDKIGILCCFPPTNTASHPQTQPTMCLAIGEAFLLRCHLDPISQCIFLIQWNIMKEL